MAWKFPKDWGSSVISVHLVPLYESVWKLRLIQLILLGPRIQTTKVNVSQGTPWENKELAVRHHLDQQRACTSTVAQCRVKSTGLVE